MKNKELKKKLREKSRKQREQNPDSNVQADSSSSERLHKKRRRPQAPNQQASEDLNFEPQA